MIYAQHEIVRKTEHSALQFAIYGCRRMLAYFGVCVALNVLKYVPDFSLALCSCLLEGSC